MGPTSLYPSTFRLDAMYPSAIIDLFFIVPMVPGKILILVKWITQRDWGKCRIEMTVSDGTDSGFHPPFIRGI